MNIKSSEIIHIIRTAEDNPRNSEGSFARLKDGRILFAYSRFHGNSWKDEAPSDIAALTLRADGRSLCSETPEILVAANEYENISNIMSVSLLRMGNDDLGLFYCLKHDRAAVPNHGFDPIITECVCRRSSDDATFPKESEVLCNNTCFKSYFVLNNDRVLKTSSGRIIVPTSRHQTCYTPTRIRFDGIGHGKIFYSDDDGLTWNEVYGEITMPSTAYSQPWMGFQEPGIVELPTGVLYLYARTDRMCQYESISGDNGLTWTTAQPSSFSSPCSPMKIARNPYNGLYYSVWNPIPNYNGRVIAPTTMGRTPLAIAESADGIHYSECVLIEDDPTRGFCYPAIFFLDEKNLLVSYCSGLPEEGNCLCSTTIRHITLD